jgi:hypothetical protein
VSCNRSLYVDRTPLRTWNQQLELPWRGYVTAAILFSSPDDSPGTDPAAGGRKPGLGSPQDPRWSRRNSASTSPRGAWLGICDEFGAVATRASGGLLVSRITARCSSPDSFTVPTLTFQLLYCLFVIEHGRRKILHFNVTRQPTAEWVVQQLRETFPDAGPYRYVILDRDSKFDADVIGLKATGLKPKRTSVRPGKMALRNDGREAAAARFSTMSSR